MLKLSGDRQGQDFVGHPEPKGNSGGDGDRYGGELDLHGNRSAKDVQDRAMRVDNRFELRQFLFARRALQRHDSSHSSETWTHPFVDGEKSPQVEIAIKLD